MAAGKRIRFPFGICGPAQCDSDIVLPEADMSQNLKRIVEFSGRREFLKYAGAGLALAATNLQRTPST
jgi:hypothetical protein